MSERVLGLLSVALVSPVSVSVDSGLIVSSLSGHELPVQNTVTVSMLQWVVPELIVLSVSNLGGHGLLIQMLSMLVPELIVSSGSCLPIVSGSSGNGLPNNK